MDTRLRTDREGILHPNIWPYRPILPLKRPTKKLGTWPELGVLIWDDLHNNPTSESNLSVYVNTSLFDRLTEDKLKVYKGVDALLADGWIVD